MSNASHAALPFFDADFGPLAFTGRPRGNAPAVARSPASRLPAPQQQYENGVNSDTRREMKPIKPLPLLPGRSVKILALDAGGAGWMPLDIGPLAKPHASMGAE